MDEPNVGTGPEGRGSLAGTTAGDGGAGTAGVSGSGPGAPLAGPPAPAPTDAAPAPTDAAPTDTAPAPVDATPADRAPTDRPRPLHEPDPYGTPPYGEPGPWAPAPPVQHPVATPAQGTPVHTGTPVHGTQGHGTPIPGAPAPTHGAPTHGAPTHGAPTHGAPTHGAPTHGAPTHGAPTHGAPAPGAPYPGAPGHGPQAPGSPHPAPAAHGATPHEALPHGTPAPDGTTQPASGPGAPAPEVAATGAVGPGAPVPASPVPASPGPGGAPGPHAAAPGGPWQRYDPWSAPLQQTGAAVETEKQRRRRGRQLLVLGAVVIALVAGGIGGVVGAQLERDGGFGSDVELPQADSGSRKRPKDSVAGIAASALPGVVTLHVRGDDGAGTGTGFVLDAKGHILTNNHVVEPGGSGGNISVTFSGGETAAAKVVGRDAGYDLAVVKVSGVRGLKPLPLGNSENVQVGDPVVAIGAPFDLANTVTSGIISAKERPITAGGEKGDGSDVSYVNALQTDAPINPGNSGGPLVDSRARVIGINSAIRSAGNDSGPDGGQSGSIGLGFAIPINQGKRVAEELINTGRATHPVIGVTIDKQFTGDGARIARESRDGGPAVNRGGPGAKAGLKPGDVITAVDGQRVHSGDELIVKIRAHRPKDRLELTVERGGDERKVTLVLGTASGE
ncbi:S1C family serine protease [Streptomyces flavofungini]|uniref:S1C family serine protease n=1 Tax=Streptomyces flavofungini TaxID=68200 RepID=UPI0025AFBDD4|nr:trypsin-like peptidase domain-containing protein [Streptomyces flavofungini]WJV46367.1 trypsin-like peptidase domain-containing protein [Streptomyces flavofungini]